jgi:Leucine-rich repeat (LRR) protein
MAELASGTVSSLLGVIRSELDLLGGVRADVQFMKEEMESMRSFLAHLYRTAPPGGAHSEQVRTWMDQVRRLALDCNNCIDLYLLSRRNPHIQLGRGCVLWLPWFLRKMVAKHRAANQLRELKARARDVSERRTRYAVEVPAVAMSPSGDDYAEAEGDDGDYEEEETHGHYGRPRHLEIPTLHDYFDRKLAEWIGNVGFERKPAKWRNAGAAVGSIPSIAVVAPGGQDNVESLAGEALAVARTHFKGNVISVNIGEHNDRQQIEPDDILCYILQELKLAKSSQGEGDKQQDDVAWLADGKLTLMQEIDENLKEMKLDGKIDKIGKEMEEIMKGDKEHVDLKNKVQLDSEPLNSLLLLLLKSATADATASAEQDQLRKTAMRVLAAWYSSIVEKTAKELKKVIEEDDDEEAKPQAHQIHLDAAQYECILCEVFPKTSNSASTNSIAASVEDEIKEMIHRVNEILQGLQEDKSDKKDATGTSLGQEQILGALINNEIMGKVDKLKQSIKRQMSIKGILNRIKYHVEENDNGALIIFKLNHDSVCGWEEIRNALSLMGCIAGVLIVTGSKNTQRHREYCYPLQEPIDYSLVGLYHDIVLKLTRQQKTEDNNYNPQIYRNILDDCEPYEFCMKIFAHALYANPKMSNGVLRKLHSTMQVSRKSLRSTAEKMLRFSYNDLPDEHKFCLLYLVIFPRGHSIRRSMLVGRWIAEGHITREDLQTSVHQAELCFDALIDRHLVYPADISATGKVKSCMVGDIVHEFITKIAKRQGIVESRSRPAHDLARHFSIFNDLKLHSYQGIHYFLRKLSTSQLSLLKVLDLEGCYGINNRIIKNICSKMLLLKYLSLRRTDLTHLPSEINHLRELEVLDIRQTKVPAFATKNILLLNLMRLLAGHTVPSPSNTDNGMAVQVPYNIEKMSNMEVLSSVKPRSGRDLKDIGMLWQLKKLGLVIDKDDHLINLVRAISNLNESLQSLSITLPMTSCDGLSSTEFPDDIQSCLRYSPKLLESLSICGTTAKGSLLSMLAKYGDCLVKVTLSRASLNQDELNILAKLPLLSCVRLRHIVCTQRKVTFKENEFKKLKYFLVEGSNITDIDFQHGAVLELEKIVLSFTTNIESLHGIENLPRLKELEFNGGPVPTEVEEAINKLKSRPGLNFKTQ